jgi:hypothetical protein
MSGGLDPAAVVLVSVCYDTLLEFANKRRDRGIG